MKRKKRTPEQRAADAEYRRQFDERTDAIYAYLQRRWDDLSEAYAKRGQAVPFPRPVRPPAR